MKLPNANRAIVERAKVVDYLLNAAHPDNGGKAQFFEQLGFQRTQWEALAEAFQTMARLAEVVTSEESPHGRKYVMVGQMQTPVGKPTRVQTIWIVDRGGETPRLVTAYPSQE